MKNTKENRSETGAPQCGGVSTVGREGKKTLGVHTSCGEETFKKKNKLGELVQECEG